MVPFDHIAVMGIFALNETNTLRLQNPLIKTMGNNGQEFRTPVGCIPMGAGKCRRPRCVRRDGRA
jgi:hypothetical protein